MIDETLCKHIEELWENRDRISPATSGTERNVIEEALEALDTGRLRVATLQDGAWVVHEWLKKAILLSFRLNDS
ncbi:MAG: 2,3,4,5-tetrahydropyridine-2,6-dicarboxylate N-succinyltransferase, partial [Acetobacter sp.]|nr:2,3,4,5-tetrahydropyridine-2,6-dicarboxylate N-succinyltransferase [Acetobacter sp.]